MTGEIQSYRMWDSYPPQEMKDDQVMPKINWNWTGILLGSGYCYILEEIKLQETFEDY